MSLPTKRQQQLMYKYTLVKPSDDGWLPILKVGLQRFTLMDQETKEGAEWMCWMLAIAIEKVIDGELN